MIVESQLAVASADSTNAEAPAAEFARSAVNKRFSSNASIAGNRLKVFMAAYPKMVGLRCI
jgi:hypothetical protein